MRLARRETLTEAKSEYQPLQEAIPRATDGFKNYLGQLVLTIFSVVTVMSPVSCSSLPTPSCRISSFTSWAVALLTTPVTLTDAYVFAHIDTVALEIPPATVFCNQLVLLALVPALQATCNRAALCMRVVRVWAFAIKVPQMNISPASPVAILIFVIEDLRSIIVTAWRGWLSGERFTSASEPGRPRYF